MPTAAHFLCRSLPTRLRMSYRPIFAHGLTSLGRRVFRHNRIDAICLEKPVPTAIHSHYIASSQRSSPQAISHGFPSVHPVVTSASLLPNGALSMLYFPRFPLRPPCRRFRIAPSPRSSPQPISFPSTLSSLPYAIYHGFPSVHLLVASVSLLSNGPTLPKLFPTVSLPSTLSSLLSRSFGTELSPSYFPRFPPRPPSRRFHLAPSQRGSPQAISHDGFPSVHLVVASVSLLPHGALQAIFPTVSFPSILSSLPYRSFPTELSPCYFPWFPICPPIRPPCVASVSFLLNGALHKLFPTISRPSTLSSLPHHSFTTELSQSYFPRIPSVHPVVASVSLLPNGALPTLSSLPYRSFPTELSPCYFPRFPVVHPPSRRFRLAPSPRSSPQAISHGFLRPPYRRFRLAPSQRSSPYMLFPTVSSRPPSRRFRIAPSQRGSSQAISHGFPSVHPLVASVSLLPHGALPKLFPTVSSPSTLSSLPSVPSQRSSPQAISYGFPSVHPLVTSVSLPRGKCD